MIKDAWKAATQQIEHHFRHDNATAESNEVKNALDSWVDLALNK